MWSGARWSVGFSQPGYSERYPEPVARPGEVRPTSKVGRTCRRDQPRWHALDAEKTSRVGAAEPWPDHAAGAFPRGLTAIADWATETDVVEAGR